MKKITNYTLLPLTIVMILFSCSGKNNNKKIDSVTNKEHKTDKAQYLFDDSVEPFYTVDPKLEDIESEIAVLKEQVMQYESQISTPNFI